jgi:hypothetical protein
LQSLGCWPHDLETDSVVRLVESVGDAPTWEVLLQIPAVAQRLAERSRLSELDTQILRHREHLQHVCHRPRLNLRIEEERVMVSRARRTPVRAVADLVSHPGDWEHRTLRSIHPSRVLARQVEDEWNLYENRVAVRLVDHLLAYLARRLEELRRILEILESSGEHSDDLPCTSFRRIQRITELWSSTLDSDTGLALRATISRLELVQRDLQVLLDSPLYVHVPRRETVPPALKPTNILVNDAHYRKVAALWRAWVRYGHRRHETAQQRALRRKREAEAWDRFVLHLVVRGFASLGWTATTAHQGWTLRKAGWADIQLTIDTRGVVSAKGTGVLRFLPVCADLDGAAPDDLQSELAQLDGAGGEVVVAHVGAPAVLQDVDRATGWSFAGRAVLFPCSPWGIDSEERMARLLHGWVCRGATLPYPVEQSIRALPEWPGKRDWIRYEQNSLVLFRPPTRAETQDAVAWGHKQERELDAAAQRAKAAKQAVALAPREAVSAFLAFLDQAPARVQSLPSCPVCAAEGLVEPRPGKRADGSDATWWAKCPSCESEWGLRPCTGCGARYHALIPAIGTVIDVVPASGAHTPWPDRVFGRDLWAQPCSSGTAGQFRCSHCGQCGNASCSRCRERSS